MRDTFKVVKTVSRSKRGIFTYFLFDRAMAAGMLLRIWTTGAGVASILVISHFLSPTDQGIYYTFNSLLQLQLIVDMGLGGILMTFASHEWAHIKFDKNYVPFGESTAISRLSSLARFSFIWFFIAGILFFLILNGAGFLVFSGSKVPEGINWFPPWFALAAFTAADLVCLPAWSLTEGAGQIGALSMIRLLRAMTVSVVLWAAMLAGAGLWSQPLAAGVAFMVGQAVLFGRYKNYYLYFLRKPNGPVVSWRSEILHLQSRIAVSWFSGLLWFSLFVPVLVHYVDAASAGRMGMTWAAAGAIGTIGGVWAQITMPKYGVLIARRDWAALDGLAHKVMLSSIGLCVLSGMALLTALRLIDWFRPILLLPLLDRLLSWNDVALLIVATTIQQIVINRASYLRAHKHEPIMWTSLIGGLLVATGTLTFGRYYGATAMIWTYFLAVAGFAFPTTEFIYRQCRKKWHRIEGRHDDIG
jgi:hypothetical protein